METVYRADLMVRARRDTTAAKLLELMMEAGLDHMTVEVLSNNTPNDTTRTVWTSRDVHAIVVEIPQGDRVVRAVFGPLSVNEDRRQVQNEDIRVAARPVWYVVPKTPYRITTHLHWAGALNALADMIRW